jgi:hypothetical protein
MQVQGSGCGLASNELAERRASLAEQFSELKAEIENLNRVFQTRDPNQPLH